MKLSNNIRCFVKIAVILSLLIGCMVVFCSCGNDPIVETWKHIDSDFFLIKFKDNGEYVWVEADTMGGGVYKYKRTDKKDGYEARRYLVTDNESTSSLEAVIYSDKPDSLVVGEGSNLLYFKRE